MKFTRIQLLLSLVAMFVATNNTTFAAAEADLLVAYDQTHSAAVGGEDNAQVLAANAVAGSNGVNERSGTGARVRIVGYHQAAQYLYQTTSKGGFVNWMANYDSHMTDVVDAGNARGADLVAWLCVSTADGAAAVAQQPGRYSAFDPGQFWTAVVAHELGGHNYGCDHRGGRATPGQKTVMMHNYCDGGGATPPYFFSNPNIWLNSAKLIGETSCLGAAVNGGDNAYLISTTAQGVADRNARIVTAPNLGNVILRWCFTNSAGAAPAGTTIVDAVSSSNAVVRGVGATFTGKALRIPGGTTGNTAANSISAYIDLPNGIISARTNLTIEIWATPLSAPNWARIADFGRTT
ncbi:MAG: M12 family metallo-peptidase [Verrucomicrobiota bacterium]